MSEEEEDSEDEDELGLRRVDVAALEEEGRAASAAGNNAAADRQYSAAIALEPENASLLAGRAAVRLALGERHAGRPPWIPRWRCVFRRPRGRASVAVRKGRSTESKIIQALHFGQEFRVDAEPVDGWVKLLDSTGYAMVCHPKLGTLLEPVVEGPMALDRALADCRQAIQLQPRLAQAYLLGARCLSVQGKLEDAERFLHSGWERVSVRQQHKLSVQLNNLKKIKPKLSEAEALLSANLEGEDRGKRALGFVKEATRLGAPVVKIRPLLLRALLQSRDAARAEEAKELSEEILKSSCGSPAPDARLWWGASLLLAQDISSATVVLQDLVAEATAAGVDAGVRPAEPLQGARPELRQLTSGGGERSQDLSGEWEDEDGVMMLIEGGQIRCPDGTSLLIDMGRGDSFSFDANGQRFEGSLVEDRIQWNDGCTWVRRQSVKKETTQWFKAIYKRVLVKKSPDKDAKSWCWLLQDQKVMVSPVQAMDTDGRLWAELTAFQLHRICQCDEDAARGFVLLDGTDMGLGRLMEGPLLDYHEDIAMAARTAAVLLDGLENGPKLQQRGDELLGARQWDEALLHFHACRAAASWSREMLGALHVGIAAALRETLQAAEALRHATLATQLCPRSAEAFRQRGIVHCDAGRWQESLDDLKHAKKLSGALPGLEAWLKRARHALSVGSSRKNYYWILGLLCDCEALDIKKRFRKLALECHPDKVHSASIVVVKSAEARFKAVNEAYEVLGSAEKRAAYDFGA